MALDSDLQVLMDKLVALEAQGSITIDTTLSITAQKRAIYAVQAERDRNAALVIGQRGMAMEPIPAHTKDALIERIVLNLCESYMKPGTTAVTQTFESMVTEATKDVERLMLNAKKVYEAIQQAKASW